MGWLDDWRGLICNDFETFREEEIFRQDCRIGRVGSGKAVARGAFCFDLNCGRLVLCAFFLGGVFFRGSIDTKCRLLLDL